MNLTWESETCGDAGHGGRDEMVQVTVCRCGQFKGTETDVVQGFIVDTVGLVGVLDQLVDGQGGVVGLNYGVGYLHKYTKLDTE